MTAAAIDVAGLRREFRVGSGLFGADKHVIAVDDVTFSVPAGSVLGIVGESGCGKSTLARVILGLLPPTAGEVLVEGQRLSGMDRRARARLIQPVFQDPFASLNPRRRIRDIVAMPLVAQGGIHEHQGLVSLLAQLVADEEYVGQVALLSLAGVGHVRSVHEDERRRRAIVLPLRPLRAARLRHRSH